ncbi:hypothetical protein ACSBR2_023656 [Camellia fascicularis]
MPRSATLEQRLKPATKTLFRCGRFVLRETKIRRQRVDLSGPRFREEASKNKQKTRDPPDSIPSFCGENDVEAHPKAKVFRKKRLDHMDLFNVLFANSQATGALARASTQGPPTCDKERDIQSAFFGVGINSNTDSFNVGDEIEGDDDPNVGGSSGNDVERRGAHISLALDTWIATNLAKKEFYMCQNKMLKVSQADKKQYSMKACIDYLATMEGINPDQYVKACESFRDKATRRMFMSMPPNIRMHWVLKLA